MSDLAELMDVLFNGRAARQPQPKAPSTTDNPNITLFMLQIINAYHGMIENDAMKWRKTYKHKGNGREYTVTVTLEEAA